MAAGPSPPSPGVGAEGARGASPPPPQSGLWRREGVRGGAWKRTGEKNLKSRRNSKAAGCVCVCVFTGAVPAGTLGGGAGGLGVCRGGSCRDI